MATAPVFYPVSIDIDPPAPQSRLTVFLRIFMLIPHAIVLYALNIAVQVVSLIAWFAILITGKYPEGMYGFAVGVLRWYTRAGAYGSLLTGLYPPFALDEMATYPARVGIAPEILGRNRLTTFFRPILAIPHFIVLGLLGIAAVVVMVIAWFAALITGSVPEGMHGFLAGVTRWNTRVNAYAWLLTDRYPPFSLS